jgi:hypothetical protein
VRKQLTFLDVLRDNRRNNPSGLLLLELLFDLSLLWAAKESFPSGMIDIDALLP